MKIDCKRDRNLPAFQIDLGILENLIHKILALFKTDNIKTSITFKHKSKEYSFDSVDEMRAFSELPNRINNFRLYIFTRSRQDDSSFSLNSGGFLGSPASISATSDSEAWCAGVIETGYQILNQHRVWYSYISGRPIGFLTIFSFQTPFLATIMLKYYSIRAEILYLACGSFILVMLLVYMSRYLIFPPATIQHQHSESTIKQNAAVIAIVVSILTLVFNIIAFTIGKNK